MCLDGVKTLGLIHESTSKILILDVIQDFVLTQARIHAGLIVNSLYGVCKGTATSRLNEEVP